MKIQFKLIFVFYFIINFTNSQNLVRPYDTYNIISDKNMDTIFQIGLKNGIIIDTFKVFIKKGNNKYYTVNRQNYYEIGRFYKSKKCINYNQKSYSVMQKIGIWKYCDSENCYRIYHGRFYTFKHKKYRGSLI